MGNSKVALNRMLTVLVAILVWGYSMNVAADSEPGQVANATTQHSVSPQTSERHVVEFIRDRNYACTQCHKDEQDTLKGTHGDAIHTSANRNVSCVDCHGTISDEHRNGAPTVIKFAPSQSVAGTTKPAADPRWIAQQNETCVNCHDPHDLREVNWTHDVHALDLSCASCHNVHPEQDPMKGISKSSKIKLCVDCHSDQKKAK